MQLQFLQSDFKSEYFFRTCYQSVDITQEFIPNAVLLCCADLAKYGTVPYSTIFTPITALLQAVLQANTELFRNDLVKTRNRAVELKNGLKTLLVPVQKISK